MIIMIGNKPNHYFRMQHRDSRLARSASSSRLNLKVQEELY